MFELVLLSRTWSYGDSKPQTSCMPYDFAEDPGGSERVLVVSSPGMMPVPRAWVGLAVHGEWPTDWPTGPAGYWLRLPHGWPNVRRQAPA
jgi:hypothetical protein